ncbi:MAG: hypothetical protein IH836_07760 [Proteobacteria bacterium]|nr:hypothetical protein [Pseudomonadota bacterium]
MKYLALILMMITNATYANTTSTITMDKVNLEVNQRFDNIPNNCLIVAKEKQRRLLKQGIESKIVVIQPAYATMKHAVLCVDDQCIDNGDISNNIFNKDELSYFGRVL